jgi:hypothetical protein
MAREPLRSRLVIAGAAVLTLGMAAATYWARHRSGPDLGVVIIGAWAGLLLLTVVGNLVLFLRAWLRRGRRWGFDVVPGAFDVPFGVTPAPNIAQSIVLCGGLAAFLIAVLDRRTMIALAPLVAVLIIMIVFGVATAWRGILLRLTPEGLVYRGPLFHQFVPWEALAAGGPHPPASRSSTTATISLLVTRPELVVRRGILRGTARQPSIPAVSNVDATFLAWAIRWYAEHPEDRAGIGTQIEHDRLVATLSPPP